MARGWPGARTAGERASTRGSKHRYEPRSFPHDPGVDGGRLRNREAVANLVALDRCADDRGAPYEPHCLFDREKRKTRQRRVV
jgi:hypothetical protein